MDEFPELDLSSLPFPLVDLTNTYIFIADDLASIFDVFADASSPQTGHWVARCSSYERAEDIEWHIHDLVAATRKLTGDHRA